MTTDFSDFERPIDEMADPLILMANHLGVTGLPLGREFKGFVDRSSFWV